MTNWKSERRKFWYHIDKFKYGSLDMLLKYATSFLPRSWCTVCAIPEWCGLTDARRISFWSQVAGNHLTARYWHSESLTAREVCTMTECCVYGLRTDWWEFCAENSLWWYLNRDTWRFYWRNRKNMRRLEKHNGKVGGLQNRWQAQTHDELYEYIYFFSQGPYCLE